jgi:uncharacterized membrane protein YkoI
MPFGRRSKIVLVGIVALLVVGSGCLGTLDGGAGDAGSKTTASEGEATTAGASEAQNESNENESGVPPNQTIEAVQAVENQTNGTVIGAKLEGKENDELGAAEFVYKLDVLAANESHLVAEVYAANATVIGVESANDSDGFLGDLFGSDDVPDEARNPSDLRPATEAVRLAANETVNETEIEQTNLTVTEVTLDEQNDTLVYRVSLVDAEGEPHEVLVAADEEEGDIVTTDSQAIWREVGAGFER